MTQELRLFRTWVWHSFKELYKTVSSCSPGALATASNTTIRSVCLLCYGLVRFWARLFTAALTTKTDFTRSSGPTSRHSTELSSWCAAFIVLYCPPNPNQIIGAYHTFFIEDHKKQVFVWRFMTASSHNQMCALTLALWLVVLGIAICNFGPR